MLSFLKKKWCLEEVSPEKVFALIQELNIPRTLAILLINNGWEEVGKEQIIVKGNIYTKFVECKKI